MEAAPVLQEVKENRLFHVLVEDRLKIQLKINHNAQCHSGTVSFRLVRNRSLRRIPDSSESIRDCGNDK